MNVTDLSGKTALVTGGGSGIGLELAREFARHGAGLILTGRTEARLVAAAEMLRAESGVPVRVIVNDLCAAGGTDALWEAIAAAPPELLAANAGAGLWCRFDDPEKRESQLDEIRLNVLALTDLTARLLPSMRSRGFGRVLLLGSTAAFQPGPFMSVYYATKAYVLSLGRALSAELRDTGVNVTVLCPGPTRSEFFDRAGMRGQSRLKRALGLMDTAAVARCGVLALLAGRREAVPGFFNRCGTVLGRHLPTALVLRVVAALQRLS